MANSDYDCISEVLLKLLCIPYLNAIYLFNYNSNEDWFHSNRQLRYLWLDLWKHAGPGAVLEILLSSFQAACLSRMRAVESSRRVFSDATTQIFAKISNFPSWRPKKKGLHCISLTKSWNKGQLTLLFSPLCMPRETLWPKRGAPIVEGKSWVVSGNLRNPSKTAPVQVHIATKISVLTFHNF